MGSVGVTRRINDVSSVEAFRRVGLGHAFSRLASACLAVNWSSSLGGDPLVSWVGEERTSVCYRVGINFGVVDLEY